MKPGNEARPQVAAWIPGTMALLLAGPGFLLVSAICSIHVEKERIRTEAAQEREKEEIRAMERLEARSLEAEGEFRGFVLTRDTTFLSHYFEARNSLLPAVAEIEKRINHPGESERMAKVRKGAESVLEAHDIVSNVVFLDDSPRDLGDLMRENKRRLDNFQQTVAELRSAESQHIQQMAGERERTRNAWQTGQLVAILLGLVTGCAGLVLLRRAATVQPRCTLKLLGVASECAADMRARKSTAWLDAILASAREVPIITTTPDGTIDGFNAAAEQVFGYTADEMLGESILRTIAEPEKTLTELAADGEWICRRKDGVPVLLKARLTAIRDAQDDLIGYAAVGVDVTAASRNQMLFDTFMQHNPALSSVKDESGRIVYLNGACQELWRTCAADANGRLEFELLPLEMAQQIRANDTAVRESGQPGTFTETYMVPDGEQRTFLSHRFPLQLPGHGMLIGNMSVDITAHSVVEHQLSALREELVSQTERAWKTTRVKDAFLASMSHEIRTPVNAMTGMADLLWDTNLDDEQRTFVRIFRTNAEQLLCIINDILDLAKVESGEMRIASERLDLAALVQETVELMRMGAQAKGLSLTATLPPGIPLGLLGDASRIRQILVNLVGNAIKFTERGGIHISVRQETENPEFFRFEVADTGQGIPPGREASIFQPFVQCDASLAKRNAGAGLGLSICQRLTDLMGGTIGVESKAGAGSAFWFSIPLRRDPTLVVVTAPLEARGPALLLGVAGDRNRMVRVLLVDDLPDNAFLVRCLLRNVPVELESVCDGEEALARVKEQQYDLILMDLVMPGIDGHTATRRLREWERTEGIAPTPVVALTAHALREEMEKSLDAGCDAHITKPIRRPDLIDAIARYSRAPRRRQKAQILSQLRDIVPEFIERRKQDIDILRRALEEGDYAKVHIVGHNLKGSGGGYGFQPISEIGVNLERAVAQKDDADIARSIEALAIYLDEVDVEYITAEQEIPA